MEIKNHAPFLFSHNHQKGRNNAPRNRSQQNKSEGQTLPHVRSSTVRKLPVHCQALDDQFDLIQFGALFIPPKVDGSTQRTLHDYWFTYTTNAGGQINIAMCAFDKPLQDVIIGEAGFSDSQVNDTTLKIYGTRDYFIAEFNHQNINYYITANGITIEALQTVLCDIILVD